jgi:hypothetical protein
MRVILDAVKDHLIPHLSEKKTAKEMFDALVSLYQSENINRKMVLRNKLRSTQMSRSDSVTSYLMKITQIRDQLAAVGEKVDDAELVNTTLNGFSKPWEPFVKGICAREKLPTFERLWDDCIQEETQEESKANRQEGDENLALVSQTRKGKGKGSGKSKGEESASQPGKRKDLSKIKCFICHKHGHFASQCPEKKGKLKSQQVATSTKTQMDEFVAKFEKDFSLVSCFSTSTVSRSAWYVDSGASSHMTSARELFTSLTKQDSRLHVELGNDAKYAVKGVGTISFQLESGSSLEVKDVLYVPGLTKNLLSVSVMEDKGFVIVFQKGQALIRRKDLALTQLRSLGLEREICTGYGVSLFEPWFIAVTTCVSYGTRGWGTCITGRCRF